MKSCTVVKFKYPATELEDYPALCSVISEMWDSSKPANKWSTWFCLHGATVAVLDENQALAAELVFLRELWADMNGFGS